MKITIADIFWSLIGRLMISVNWTYLLYPEMNLNGYFNSLRFPFKCCINSSNIRLLKSKQLCCFHRPHATVNIYETIFHPEYHKRIFHMHIYVQHACHWTSICFVLKYILCETKIFDFFNGKFWWITLENIKVLCPLKNPYIEYTARYTQGMTRYLHIWCFANLIMCCL